jgi:hypothetical protein
LVYLGHPALVALKGAKDFQADDSIEFHTLEDHHIFPKAYLRKHIGSDGETLPASLINSIVNRTLISAQTNRRISRSSPSKYVEKLVPTDHCAEIMGSHFIDADGLEAMESDNYDMFVDARELSLMTEVVSRLDG